MVSDRKGHRMQAVQGPQHGTNVKKKSMEAEAKVSDCITRGLRRRTTRTNTVPVKLGRSPFTIITVKKNNIKKSKTGGLDKVTHSAKFASISSLTVHEECARTSPLWLAPQVSAPPISLGLSILWTSSLSRSNWMRTSTLFYLLGFGFFLERE